MKIYLDGHPLTRAYGRAVEPHLAQSVIRAFDRSYNSMPHHFTFADAVSRIVVDGLVVYERGAK